MAALRRLLDTAGRCGTRLVLATQALNYGGPDNEARVATWTPMLRPPGGVGLIPSPELTAKLLARFNSAVTAFGAAHNVEIVDLAAELADCAACFYDQWHFTEEGADRAAALLAPAIARALERAPGR